MFEKLLKFLHFNGNNRDCPEVTYHVTALVEKLGGRWASPILYTQCKDIEKLNKVVEEGIVRGADTVIIKIDRGTKNE